MHSHRCSSNSALFPYKHYELLTTILMRSAQNTGGSAEGVIRPIQTTDQILMLMKYRMSYERVGRINRTCPSHSRWELAIQCKRTVRGRP